MMRILILLALALAGLFLLADTAEAGRCGGRGLFRGRIAHRSGGGCSAQSAAPTVGVGCGVGSADLPPQSATVGRKALDEVNRQRAAKGLRPYILCLELQRAAEECATYRARWRIRGHTNSDMSFAAPGYATCAGCAAWPAGSGFGACAIDANYTYAGAATVRGDDGLEYHQLLLR